TGLLLFRIAPHCSAYHGTDISSTALTLVRRQLVRRPDLGGVKLSARAAHELADLPPSTVDTVLLNSVVQYFPDVGYLRDVLRAAVRLGRPGGRVVVGDVRSRPLLTDLHAAVQLDRAPGDLPAG